MDYKSKYFKYREKNILLEQQLGGEPFSISSSLDLISLPSTIKQLILDVVGPRLCDRTKTPMCYAPFCATAKIAPNDYKYLAFLTIANGRLLCEKINNLMKNDDNVWRACSYGLGVCQSSRNSKGIAGSEPYIIDIPKIKCKANHNVKKNPNGIEAEIEKLEFDVDNSPLGHFVIKLHISGIIPAIIGFGRTKKETWVTELKLVGIGGNAEKTSCGDEKIVVDGTQFKQFKLDGIDSSGRIVALKNADGTVLEKGSNEEPSYYKVKFLPLK